MATRIRLRRVGRKGQSYFRIVVADSRSPRDGRFVATLGNYNPRTNPARIQVDAEQTRAWLEKGAAPRLPPQVAARVPGRHVARRGGAVARSFRRGGRGRC